jgi:ComEC/Rec2-related protein
MRNIIHSIKRELDDVLLKLPESPKRQLALTLTALGLGTAAGTFLALPSLERMIPVAVFGLGLAIFAVTRKPVAWKTLAVALVVIGALSGMRIGNERSILPTFAGEDVTYVGRVTAFPRASGASFSSTVRADESSGTWSSFPLQFSSPIPYERGSIIALTCKMNINGNRYACRGGTSQLITPPSTLIYALNRIRDAAYQATANVLPVDEAALLAGMVYGGDDALSKQVRDDFRAAGLSHLVAVSGANLAVVTILLYGLLTATWFSRKRAALIAASILALTVIFVGFDASVVRAGLMGGILLLARFLGRPRSGGNALLLAAVMMMFLDPWLVFDLGFLLSVSATAGLMLLSQPLEERLTFIPEFGSMRGAIATALAAWLSTVPVIALVIGNVSLVSPFANILAVPFAFCIFLLGIAWFLTLWIPFVPALLAFPMRFLLQGLRFVAALFATVPGSTITNQFICITVSIGALALSVWLITKRNGRELPSRPA